MACFLSQKFISLIELSSLVFKQIKRDLGNNSTFSTLQKERENNSTLKLKSKEEFYKYMTEDWPPKPLDYQNTIRLIVAKSQ